MATLPKRRRTRRLTLATAGLCSLVAACGGGGGGGGGAHVEINNGVNNISTGGSAANPPTSSPSAPSTTASSKAAPTSAAGQYSYTTGNPFPLCDPSGGSWALAGLQPQAPNGCSAGSASTPVTVQSGTYGFATMNGLPSATPISPINTVTVTGSLTGLPNNHQRCLGVAEGDAQTAYFGYICNSGTWHVAKVANLGSQGASLGAEITKGQFPFGADQPYTIALSLRPGKLVITISLASSTNSPLTQEVAIPSLTPTTIGFGYGAGDPTLPINPSDFYGKVGQFSYKADGG
ncbi:MAG: hypothetical protein ACJ786_36995 [Catenulispora sp.]